MLKPNPKVMVFVDEGFGSVEVTRAEPSPV
jgi:hypothetical protein